MKAIVVREFGAPEVMQLAEVPAPNLEDGVERAGVEWRRGGSGERAAVGDIGVDLVAAKKA